VRAEGHVVLAQSTTSELSVEVTSIHSGGAGTKRYMAGEARRIRMLPTSTSRARSTTDRSAEPRQGFCFGDGTDTPCPCGNSGFAGTTAGASSVQARSARC
jgi:hypothetical protein